MGESKPHRLKPALLALSSIGSNNSCSVARRPGRNNLLDRIEISCSDKALVIHASIPVLLFGGKFSLL